MYKHLSKNNKLLVISDTGIVKTEDGCIAFGPVVIELNSLLQEFDEITWIGFLKKNQISNKSYIKVTNKKIKIITLKDVGGKSILSKSKIIFYYPIMIFVILKEILKNDKIHTRAPSNPAIIAVFLSFFFRRKNFWHKYAGSWIDKTSTFYDFQRKILKRLPKNSVVTINGNFSNKKNIISFENPCINEDDRKLGLKILENKRLDTKINFCFVGGLTDQKGVDVLLEAFLEINSNRIGTIHFVGDGDKKEEYLNLAEKLKYKTNFHGFLDKNSIKEIYSKCHFLILPSKSEGFPKVVGEAMNFGCVPIVSDVSCINQYITHKKNGFLLFPIEVNQLKENIVNSINLDMMIYKYMIESNYKLSKKFTYLYYNKRIITEIFKKELIVRKNFK